VLAYLIRVFDTVARATHRQEPIQLDGETEWLDFRAEKPAFFPQFPIQTEGFDIRRFK
jgi:hypothetical protein